MVTCRASCLFCYEHQQAGQLQQDQNGQYYEKVYDRNGFYSNQYVTGVASVRHY